MKDAEFGKCFQMIYRQTDSQKNSLAERKKERKIDYKLPLSVQKDMVDSVENNGCGDWLDTILWLLVFYITQ